jgi:hypothetical protein
MVRSAVVEPTGSIGILPKTSTRKLKVFQAQFGFFDTVLAAPSQAAALKAWGTHRNLFATGHAKVATDEAAIAAALERPGILLRRALGSNEPFAVEPTSLPKIPDLPNAEPAAARPLAAKVKPKPAPRPPADRSRLNAAEAALCQLDGERKREETDLRREQEELDAKRTAAQQDYVEARKRATTAVVAVRDAYRKAGGTD